MMDGNCDFLFQTALKLKSLTVQAIHQVYKRAHLGGFSQDPLPQGHNIYLNR